MARLHMTAELLVSSPISQKSFRSTFNRPKSRSLLFCRRSKVFYERQCHEGPVGIIPEELEHLGHKPFFNCPGLEIMWTLCIVSHFLYWSTAQLRRRRYTCTWNT